MSVLLWASNRGMKWSIEGLPMNGYRLKHSDLYKINFKKKFFYVTPNIRACQNIDFCSSDLIANVLD